MNRTLTISLVLLALAAFVGYLTLFTVDQTEQALVLEFGKPKRIITEPGLQYKIPFIQNVEFFDKRILDVDTASQEVIAEAKGEADRFLSVYEQYKKAPDVTRKRIFIDTMEKVLGDSDKVIIDGKAGPGVVPYLPLPEFSKRPAPTEAQPQ